MNLTKIDWCAFRSKARSRSIVNRLSGLFSYLDEFEATDTGRGWNGYEKMIALTIRDKRIGFLATGGEPQKGWSQVNLTGEAMEHIANPAANLTGLVSDLQGQYKRVDIALTTKDGSVSAQTVLAAYRSGGFDVTNRRPSCSTIVPEDPTHGTTVNIGKRTQPKFLRAYDKGYQLLAKWNAALPDGELPMIAEDCPGGVDLAKLFRVELELKPEPHLFPDDLLERSDSYFAGAYPYLGRLVDSHPETFSLSPQRSAALGLDQALAHIRRQYGPILFTALAAHDGDYMAVWQKIVGDKHSQTLLDAGVRYAEM